MQTTKRASATQWLTHPQLPKIKGFYWNRIREAESRDGGLEATTLLMEPGERAAMLTIVLYPDRVVLRHLLVDSGFYTRGSSYRGQGLGSKIGAAVLAAYGHLPIDVWFSPDQDDPGLTAEQLRAWAERHGFDPHPDPEKPHWMRRLPQQELPV
jgi:hypothetical protein